MSVLFIVYCESPLQVCVVMMVYPDEGRLENCRLVFLRKIKYSEQDTFSCKVLNGFECSFDLLVSL